MKTGRLAFCSSHCQLLMSGALGSVQVPTCRVLRVVVTPADSPAAAAAVMPLPLRAGLNGEGGWLREAGGAVLCWPASAAGWGCWGGNVGAAAGAWDAAGRPRRALRSRMGYSGACCCLLLPVGDSVACCLLAVGCRGACLLLLRTLPPSIEPRALGALTKAAAATPQLPRISGWAGSGGRLAQASGFHAAESAAGMPAGEPASASAKRTDFLLLPSCRSSPLLEAAAVLCPSPAAAAWTWSGAPRGCILPSCSSARSLWLAPPAQNSAAGAAGSPRWERTSPVLVQQMARAAPPARASRAASLLRLTAVTGAEEAADRRACWANSPPLCRHTRLLPSEQPTDRSAPAAARAVTRRSPASSSPASCSWPPLLLLPFPLLQALAVLHTLTTPLRSAAVAASPPSSKKQAAAMPALLPLQQLVGAAEASCVPSARPHSLSPPCASPDSTRVPQGLAATQVMSAAAEHRRAVCQHT